MYESSGSVVVRAHIAHEIAYLRVSGTVTKSAIVGIQDEAIKQLRGLLAITLLCDLRGACLAISAADVAARLQEPSMPIALVINQAAASAATEYAWTAAQAGFLRRVFLCPQPARDWVLREAALIHSLLRTAPRLPARACD
jgi:hypothetical protein